jgi:hypothetical protein
LKYLSNTANTDGKLAYGAAKQSCNLRADMQDNPVFGFGDLVTAHL